MGYANRILSEHLKIEGSQRSRRKLFVDSVACAYCQGSGVDPKYGNNSKCHACGGAAKIELKSHVVTCLKCQGIGRESGDLSCLACRGIGVVFVDKDAATCPNCKGTGEDGIFYCSPCEGQGIA